MSLEWFWISLGVLAVLVLYQQFRIYSIRRVAKKNEELFQIVTENAADMIALVDVKGGACTTARLTKKSWGTQQPNWARLRLLSRFIPTTASKCSKRRGKPVRRASDRGWSIASSIRMEVGGCLNRWPARCAMPRVKWRSW